MSNVVIITRKVKLPNGMIVREEEHQIRGGSETQALYYYYDLHGFDVYVGCFNTDYWGQVEGLVEL